MSYSRYYRSVQRNETHGSKYILRALLQALANDLVVPKHAVGTTLTNVLQQNDGLSQLSVNSVGQTLRRVERRGYVQRKKEGSSVRLRLTDAGRDKLQRLSVPQATISCTGEWDGFWRVVLFSIPEGQKHIRALLRQKLRSIGFVPFRRSAWIFPFVCDEQVANLVQNLGITDRVNLLTVSTFSNSEQFEQRFNLSRSTLPSGLVQLEDISNAMPVDVSSPMLEDDGIIPLSELD